MLKSASYLSSVSKSPIFANFKTPLFFVALIACNAFITPNFCSMGTLENTLVQVSPLMLVALGMTLVISSGGIDISVGAIMAIAAAVSARLSMSDAWDLGWVPAVACGLVAGGLAGLFNGSLIGRWKMQPIIVTLVVLIAGRGLAKIILGELFISLSYTSFGNTGQFRVAGVPVQIVIMAVAIGVMLFISKKSLFAKQVEVIGENPRAARLIGLNRPFVVMGVYTLCGVLCAVAGNMEAARINVVDVGSLGVLIELDAIAAVAIGGTSFSGGKARIVGTVFGAIVVQLVTVIVNMNNIAFHYSLIFKALIVIVVLWTQRTR